MSIEIVFQVILISSTFFCSLVAGFLFAFAVVVIPGINNLNDREFIRAFQVMDGVIQKNQPVFILVWIGSFILLVSTTIIGFWYFEGIRLILLVSAVLVYSFGVQLPTVAINIPLNNKLQSMDADATDEKVCKEARWDFEPRWRRWNSFRTIMASLVSLSLMTLLFGI